MHVYVLCSEGEARIWIEPEVEVASQKGLKEHEMNDLLKVAEERIDEIKEKN